MRSRRLGIACATVLAVAVPATSAQAQDGPYTVYSSLPLSGASRPQSLAIVQGARLALEEAGGRAGAHRIRYVSLDDATNRAGAWTPRRTQANARRAARDASTIGYIGEFNSGASAISIPLLNEAGIAQISPSNTAVGLTRGGPGTEPGEPSKYYPAGPGTYFRLAPNDRVQAGALAVAMRDRGCRRVASLTDGERYGKGLGTLTRRRAGRLGLDVVLRRDIDPNARSYRTLARRVRRSRPRCVVYTGITANNAVRLFRALARALPKARFFGSDGIAESAFADPLEGGVPRRVGRRVLITVSTLAPSAYPPAGQDVLRRYAERYGDTDPFALRGYEAMRLFLDAVAAVGPDRRAVIDWLATVDGRPGAIGTFGFDRFGDITLRTYGLYRIRRGLLEWAGAVEAP